MSERSTLRDVARRANVSLGTASQALSNKPGVAPNTRTRVFAAAAELGYQQQIRLSTPISQNLSMVGLLMKRDPHNYLTVNPFYSYVLAGAERECQRQNLSLMYANLDVDEQNRGLSWPPMLFDRRVDGILVVGAFLQETITHISQQTNQTIVLVDSYVPYQQFDSIVTDNLNGAYNAVKYLIEHGHTRIGLVGSAVNDYPSIRERRKGYTRALKEYGITETYIEDSALTREDGYEAARRLLKRSPDITAIFACNDNVAIGVMNAADQLGLSVPGDLSIVGFDDIDLTQEVAPPLTTVHVDKTLMGVLAVRQLRDRVENPERPTLTTALSTQLIVRESVRTLK
ncbi:MAG TPA: LacI family DNA-binding transcriptional regulator [Aggregatilineaceae bacterium]|nr:LacI family DNA-binding transcriptional regulator [Aggregatilineaceae bacterium]